MKKIWFWVIILTALLLIFPLGWRELFSPDETRYAEIAREMIGNNDFVTPRLNGVLYFEKPVMGYWCQAASMMLFGENAFGVRFPSVLAALLSAWCIYLLGRRFSGGRKEGLLSAAIFLLFPLVFGLAGIATLDGMLACFLTLGMTAFYYAVRSNRVFRRIFFLFLAGLAFGAAFLTKGFLVFAVGALAIGGWLIWTKRWNAFLTLPWIPLLGVLAITLPWGLAVHQAQPEYWDYFFWEEHIRRFFGGEAKAQHSEPFFYFIPVLLAGVGYFLVLTPSAFAGLGKRLFRSDFYRYCFCWFLLPFLFFSASSGKLATYILPCFAPLALLLGAGLRRRVVTARRYLEFNIGTLFLACALPVAVLVLIVIQSSGVSWMPFGKGEGWKYVLVAIAGIFLAVWLQFAVREPKPWMKLALFCLGFVPVLLLTYLVVPQKVYAVKSPGSLIRAAKQKAPPQVRLMSFRYPFQDVCWEFRSSGVDMFLAPGEIMSGVAMMERQAAAKGVPFKKVYNMEETLALIDANRGKGGVLIVMPNKIYEEFGGRSNPSSATREWLTSGNLSLLPGGAIAKSDSAVFRMENRSPAVSKTLPEPEWILTAAFLHEGGISRKKWMENYQYDSDDIHESFHPFNRTKPIPQNGYSVVKFQ